MSAVVFTRPKYLLKIVPNFQKNLTRMNESLPEKLSKIFRSIHTNIPHFCLNRENSITFDMSLTICC